MMLYLETTKLTKGEELSNEYKGYKLYDVRNHMNNNINYNGLSVEDYIHITFGAIGLILIILCSIFFDIYISLILLPSFPPFMMLLIKFLKTKHHQTSVIYGLKMKKSDGFVLNY